MDVGSELQVAETIDRIGRPVEARIDALLTTEVERWSSLDPSLIDPLESLRTFVLAGGKRLRPAFAYWAFLAAGGDPLDPSIIDVGAALELLHSFALIHDDVMDGSRSRRGSDAIHARFEKNHLAHDWRGEPRRFGEGVAILVGDMAFVYADFLMGGTSATARDVFSELRVELNVGQYLDLSATVRADVSPAMARKIAQYKSGKYTVERPMHLGAALANRFDDLSEPFSAYGAPVGEAFQLRDDVLGAFGDQQLTGKPVGGDLREGKPTALLAIAVDRANDTQAKLLTERYGAPDLTDDEVNELQQVIEDTGARTELETAIAGLVAQGLAALDDLRMPSQAHGALIQLAHFVAGRSY